jgi:hypothetical protein
MKGFLPLILLLLHSFLYRLPQNIIANIFYQVDIFRNDAVLGVLRFCERDILFPKEIT